MASRVDATSATSEPYRQSTVDALRTFDEAAGALAVVVWAAVLVVWLRSLWEALRCCRHRRRGVFVTDLDTIREAEVEAAEEDAAEEDAAGPRAKKHVSFFVGPTVYGA